MKSFPAIFYKTLIFLLVVMAFRTHASDNILEFFTSKQEIAPESEFFVDVYFNSQEAINAFELELGFLPERMKFIGSLDNGSVVDVWRQRAETPADGLIVISGGMTAPRTQRGKIITLRFRARGEGEGKVFLLRGNVYVADGAGSEIVLQPVSLSIAFKNGLPIMGPNMQEDSTGPHLSAEIVTSPFDRQKIVFVGTSDNETGVLEITMRARNWISWSESRSVRASFGVPEGAWALQVRSINNAGLAAQQTVIVWGSFFKKAGILLGLMFVALLCFFFGRRARFFRHRSF